MAATYAPVKYGRQIRVRVTPRMLTEIKREMLLTGEPGTEIMRRALEMYFAPAAAAERARKQSA